MWSKMWQDYQLALRNSPLKTKTLTSATVAMLGELTGQLMRKKSFGDISPRQLLAFFIFGSGTGPILHYWYGFLETQSYTKSKLTPNQKLLLDRLLFTPPFVFLTLFTINILRGTGISTTMKNIRQVYLKILFMNWRIWTISQYLSFHYIKPEFRVLWGNCIAFGWNLYLSMLQ